MYIILYYIILYYIILYYIILYHIILYYITLLIQHSTICQLEEFYQKVKGAQTNKLNKIKT